MQSDIANSMNGIKEGELLHQKRPSLKHKCLMLHGLGFTSGDSTVKISYPFTFHPGVQVTVTEPGNAKWLYMMLPLSKGDLITEIRVAYYSGSRSRISFIRLVEQREPVAAAMLHERKMPEEMPSMSEASTSCRVVVNKSVLLKVCLDFVSTNDMIEIGSVEVKYIPEYNTLQDSEKKKEKISFVPEGIKSPVKPSIF